MDKKKEKGPGSHFWIARALEPKKKTQTCELRASHVRRPFLKIFLKGE